MERRLLLAVALMTAAIFVTNVLFPPPEPPPAVETQAQADSLPPPAALSPAAPLPTPAAQPLARPDTVIVESPIYRFALTTQGAAVAGAELLAFPSYSVVGTPVQLVPPGAPGLFLNQLVVGSDTIDLRAVSFAASTQRLEVNDSAASLDFSYADSTGFGIALRYAFEPDSYLVRVSGLVSGLGGRNARLLSTLGPSLGMHEHPDHRSEREFAAVLHPSTGVERLYFRSLDEPRAVPDTLDWAGIKDKYFLAALVASGNQSILGAEVWPVASATVEREGEEIEVPQANVVAVLPIGADGAFEFAAYLGPQDYSGLSAIGNELEEVTPYGYRWLQPVIRPLAAAVLWVLNTLHDTFEVEYGWVLAIFGVMMRIVLWPLNARAMRAQMKNMGVQPLLAEIKEKYKDDPKKQQEAMLALYKEHGFNPFGGCLPMLAPMPVLITLFFVFQNTIAFRGARFLWLPDLSLRDPYYILPLILVVSMYGIQWISAHMSGMEQNPQMKMMMYVMPVMMGVLFFMLPSGLNLYYAVTQIASIPQQVLIARERKEAQEQLKASGGLKLPTVAGEKRRKAQRPKR